MQPNNNPKILISFLGGSGGNFLVSIFLYLLHNISPTVDPVLGHAHHTTPISFGPEWETDEKHLQKYIPHYFLTTSNSVNRNMHLCLQFVSLLNRTLRDTPEYTVLTDVLLHNRDSPKINNFLIAETHIIHREFLNRYYNSEKSTTKIISITLNTLDEFNMSMKLAQFKNKNPLIRTPFATLPVYTKNSSDDTVTNLQDRFPFRLILDKDVEGIYQFVLAAARSIDLEVNDNQAATVKNYIIDYLNHQPVL